MDDISKKMFEHACAFSDLAELCEKENDYLGNRTYSHFIAGIVNSAFSIEVFLKLLLVRSGINLDNLHVHDLINLWEKLVQFSAFSYI